MLSIVVQAGGESSRMGEDKALKPFLGEPLIKRVLRRVSSVGEEILVTTNHPERYRFLNVPVVPDLIPGRGALGGLYTALQSANQPLAAVVACDMPFVSGEILSVGKQILAETGADAVIPKTEHGLEPIHAVYRRETCLPAVKAAIDADQWRMISWHDQVQIHTLRPEVVARYDPHKLAFRNVNTPEEFRAAEELARQLE